MASSVSKTAEANFLHYSWKDRAGKEAAFILKLEGLSGVKKESLADGDFTVLTQKS